VFGEFGGGGLRRKRWGLVVLWQSGISVVLKSKSKNHIDLEVSKTGGEKWRFTGIYGEPQSNLKYKTWELIECLKDQDREHLSWLCAGDFNEIYFIMKRKGCPTVTVLS
jgi:hypothetical protein